jgi:hypothetical protein
MSADPSPVEHRWGLRVDLDAPAEITTTDGTAAAGVVRNASISGAYVETRLPLTLMARVFVRPAARGDRLPACVVRVDKDGVALEWLDPGTHPVAALARSRRALDSGKAVGRESVEHHGAASWLLEERLYPLN